MGGGHTCPPTIDFLETYKLKNSAKYAKYFSRTIYAVLNATIFTFISTPYDMFRPQTAIIRYSVYAKTVALYEIIKSSLIYVLVNVMFLV
jgi:hypothetical protein